MGRPLGRASVGRRALAVPATDAGDRLRLVLVLGDHVLERLGAGLRGRTGGGARSAGRGPAAAAGGAGRSVPGDWGDASGMDGPTLVGPRRAFDLAGTGRAGSASGH